MKVGTLSTDHETIDMTWIRNDVAIQIANKYAKRTIRTDRQLQNWILRSCIEECPTQISTHVVVLDKSGPL